MTIKEINKVFRKDISRYLVLMDNKSSLAMFKLFIKTPGLWITFLYRYGKFIDDLAKRQVALKPIYFTYNYFYFLISLITGIDISLDAKIGAGVYIAHWGGIIVHPNAVIGENCNLSHGVTIGEGGRGENRGVPIVGNRVYIGPSAKVFGKITIGNDAAIGANAVVAKSVPDSAVVGGIPAKVLSYKGSRNFVILDNNV